MRSPLYHQILTGVLPYDEIHDYTVTSHIRFGKRPPRPRNQDANRWLQDRIWDMIMTCWSKDPKKRWEVHAVHELFSTSGPLEVQNIEAGQQQRRRLLLRIISLFQPLRDPEPGIESLVNEMDEAGSFAFPTPPEANTNRSVWRISPCRIGNG